MLGGVCALVATVLVGPRIGRFGPNGKKNLNYRGHSTTVSFFLYFIYFLNELKFVKLFQQLTGIGAFLLMMGILGYNMSAQMDLTKPGDGLAVAKSAVNTLLAGSSGAIVATIAGRATPSGGYRYSYYTMLNGAVNLFN